MAAANRNWKSWPDCNVCNLLHWLNTLLRSNEHTFTSESCMLCSVRVFQKLIVVVRVCRWRTEAVCRAKWLCGPDGQSARVTRLLLSEAAVQLAWGRAISGAWMIRFSAIDLS